jgi:hypothetical protein
MEKKLGRVLAVPRLCGHHPGICLTTEEKARLFHNATFFGFFIIYILRTGCAKI